MPGLDAYLRAFGLRVLETPIPTAGRLYYEEGRYVIRDAVRRRWGGPAPANGAPSRRGDQPAAELLVPLDDFPRAVAQIGCSPRAVERLSEGFRVSSDVILLRFLAAGARSISLWQVRPEPDRPESVSASIVRAFQAGRAPRLDPGTPSTVLSPDVVLQVACGGRADAPSVDVVPRASRWQLAAIADGGSAKASPFEPVQLGWLDDEEPAVHAAALGAQVTLLLLPVQAATTATPLWSALVPAVRP